MGPVKLLLQLLLKYWMICVAEQSVQDVSWVIIFCYIEFPLYSFPVSPSIFT